MTVINNVFTHGCSSGGSLALLGPKFQTGTKLNAPKTVR